MRRLDRKRRNVGHKGVPVFVRYTVLGSVFDDVFVLIFMSVIFMIVVVAAAPESRARVGVIFMIIVIAAATGRSKVIAKSEAVVGVVFNFVAAFIALAQPRARIASFQIDRLHHGRGCGRR